MSDDGPFCPECGEPVSATADYCMHCYEDFPAAFPAGSSEAGADSGEPSEDGQGEPPGSGVGSTVASTLSAAGTRTDDQLLDPDGVVDNSLTVVVGIAGGLVVGLIGTVALSAIIESALGFFLGVVAWLGATAHLVRRPRVQAAVSKTGYAVAAVLLLVPLIAVAPGVENASLPERAVLFGVTLGFVGPFAGVAAAVGWVASRYVPAVGSED